MRLPAAGCVWPPQISDDSPVTAAWLSHCPGNNQLELHSKRSLSKWGWARNRDPLYATLFRGLYQDQAKAGALRNYAHFKIVIESLGEVNNPCWNEREIPLRPQVASRQEQEPGAGAAARHWLNALPWRLNLSHTSPPLAGWLTGTAFVASSSRKLAPLRVAVAPTKCCQIIRNHFELN